MKKSLGEYYIKELNLIEHPEGGYYREMFRSEERIDCAQIKNNYGSSRSFYTSIYFLLDHPQYSAFHRLRSDELWCYHHGSSLTLYIIDPDGQLHTKRLGASIADGDSLQLLIPAGSWFAADVDQASSYTLMGCVVAPGFEFEDFELANGNELARDYPEHEKLIRRLTR